MLRRVPPIAASGRRRFPPPTYRRGFGTYRAGADTEVRFHMATRRFRFTSHSAIAKHSVPPPAEGKAKDVL